jgi:K+ transporter
MTKSFLTLNQFQIEEFSKYWFDLSKITFASLVIKFFEPEKLRFTTGSWITVSIGLTVTFLLAMIGLLLSREVKKNL